MRLTLLGAPPAGEPLARIHALLVVGPELVVCCVVPTFLPCPACPVSLACVPLAAAVVGEGRALRFKADSLGHDSRRLRLESQERIEVPISHSPMLSRSRPDDSRPLSSPPVRDLGLDLRPRRVRTDDQRDVLGGQTHVASRSSGSQGTVRSGGCHSIGAAGLGKNVIGVAASVPPLSAAAGSSASSAAVVRPNEMSSSSPSSAKGQAHGKRPGLVGSGRSGPPPLCWRSAAEASIRRTGRVPWRHAPARHPPPRTPFGQPARPCAPADLRHPSESWPTNAPSQLARWSAAPCARR